VNDNNKFIHNYAFEYNIRLEKKKKKKRIIILLIILLLLILLGIYLSFFYFNKKEINDDYIEYDSNYIVEESNIVSNSNIISNDNIDSNSNIISNSNIVSNKTSNKVEKDTIKPIISNISLTSTESKITVKATYSDNKTSTKNLKVLYSLNNKTWQKSNTFTGLKPVTKYTVYVKVIDSDNNYIVKSKTVTTKYLEARSNVSGVYTLGSDTIYVAELSDKSIVYSIGLPSKTSFKLSKLSSNTNGIKLYKEANIKFNNKYLIYNKKNFVRKSNYTLNQVFEIYYGGTYNSDTYFSGFFFNTSLVQYCFEMIPYTLSNGDTKVYITLYRDGYSETISADISGGVAYYKEGGPNHTIAKFYGKLDSSSVFNVETFAYGSNRPLYSMSGEYIRRKKYDLEYIIKNKIVN
jgi:flagellar basal body-associated protein FliL